MSLRQLNSDLVINRSLDWYFLMLRPPVSNCDHTHLHIQCGSWWSNFASQACTTESVNDWWHIIGQCQQTSSPCLRRDIALMERLQHLATRMVKGMRVDIRTTIVDIYRSIYLLDSRTALMEILPQFSPQFTPNLEGIGLWVKSDEAYSRQWKFL